MSSTRACENNRERIGANAGYGDGEREREKWQISICLFCVRAHAAPEHVSLNARTNARLCQTLHLNDISKQRPAYLSDKWQHNWEHMPVEKMPDSHPIPICMLAHLSEQMPECQSPCHKRCQSVGQTTYQNTCACQIMPDYVTNLFI